MTAGQQASPTQPDTATSGEPTDTDIESWAQAERKRREAWLNGPSEAEKAAWARREYERRRGERARLAVPRTAAEASRAVQRYMREMQLATEGALSLMFKMSISDAFDALVEAGRAWEDEFTTQPPRRRRVALDAESEREVAAAQARVPHPPEGSSVSS